MAVFLSFFKNVINKDTKKYMSENELYIFSKNMYYLLSGKVDIIESLNIVSKNYNEIRKKSILLVKKEIEKGQDLKKAFSIITDDKDFLEMIKIAQNIGNTEEIFKNIYEKYEFRQKLKKDIRNLSIYPIIVMFTAVIIVGILLKFVVPKFRVIYEDLGQELPILTKVVLQISDFFDKYVIIVLIFIVVLLILLKKYIKSNKENIEKIILKLPFFGKIYKEIYILNFSKNMYTLLNSEIMLLEALKLCENTKSAILKKEVKKVIKKIEKGYNINKSFKNCMFFDKEYISFLEIGEKTGNMTFTFKNLTKMYTEKVEEKIKMFLKILEPSSILIIGIVIGVIVFSVMQPMFNMGELIK